MDNQFPTVALAAIKKSEEIILHYYNDTIRYTLKKDQSPVTLADQEAEQIIKDTIRASFPTHAFLGEETGKDVSGSEYLWIIDPIDGTKNYLRKIPLFATQLALMYRGQIIFGISNAPVLHECIHAERGKGTYMNGTQIHVSKTTDIKQSYMCFGGLKSFDKVKKMESLLELIDTTLGHRGIGDFWCYHLLAQGKIDSMIEAQTKIWDIAAVSLIVEEAGGKVTDMYGAPLSLQTTSFLATNGLLHEEILGYLK